MDKLELKHFIRTNVMNVPVDEQSLEIIAEQFEAKTIQKDDYLLKEGKVSNYYFFQLVF